MTARDYLDFNGPGIGSLEICFGGPENGHAEIRPRVTPGKPLRGRTRAQYDRPSHNTRRDGNPFLQAAMRFKKGLRKRGQLI